MSAENPQPPERPIADDPSHPALLGQYEPGQAQRINYFREERTPWQAVEIFLTLRCPLACFHCITNSHPARGEQMEEELLKTVLAELAELGRTRWVCLFGGEPLLEPRLLTLGIRETRRLGMIPTVVTSGAWAGSESEAARGAETLEGSGTVMFSTDRAHTRFVDLETLIRGMAAVRAQGLHVSLCYTAERDEFGMAQPVPAELMAACGSLDVGCVVTPMTDGGRASRHPELLPRVDPAVPCGKIDVPLIGCDGEVYACGPGWTIPAEGRSRHRLGNARVEGLNTIFRRRYNSPILETLRWRGPLAALEELSELDGELERRIAADPPSSPCAACRLVSLHAPGKEPLWAGSCLQTAKLNPAVALGSERACS
ncbi:MAG: hypothetical protein RLY93_09715 [Sumerlaeia bacterium]